MSLRYRCETQLNQDAYLDNYSRRGNNFFTSTPSYTTRARDDGPLPRVSLPSGGLPPGGGNPHRGFGPKRSSVGGGGVDRNASGLSTSSTSPFANDPYLGLSRFQLAKFSGKEKDYELWKLQLQKTYSVSPITAEEKVLFFLG